MKDQCRNYSLPPSSLPQLAGVVLARYAPYLKYVAVVVICAGIVVYVQGNKARVGNGLLGGSLFPTRAFNPVTGNYRDTTVQLRSNTTVTRWTMSPFPSSFPDTTLQLSGNTTITDVAPTAATSINVSTSTNFKGLLEGDPTTGVVRVTNAHPAGTYTVTVTFDGGLSTTTFMLTVTTPATCNPVTFATAANFGAGTNPRSVAVGDFNGDGKQDLVTANQNSNLSVLLGNGSGNFGAATNFAAGSQPTEVAVGDFNGDGNEDLAASNATSDNVSVLTGNGAGGFSGATNFSVGSVPLAVAVGDFNRDSKQDLAVANVNSDSVSILLGNGAGGFGGAANFGVGTDPKSVAVGDFNGDGNPDFATANQVSSDVSVLLGNGGGGFGGATTLVAGPNPESVAVGDFNQDGNQDLAIANSNSGVSILLGNGAGGFGNAANFAAGTTPSEVAVGDFNGDGKRDLAVANGNSSNVSVLLGNGAGSFSLPLNFGTGTSPASVAVGDFNGDGKQDLATANFNSNNVSVLLRQCPPTISINDVSVTEGNSGTINAVFTVSLSTTSSQTVTVNYTTADGTAAAGSDYQAINSSTLTFIPGVTSLPVNVQVMGDTLDEPDETFSVNLSGATNATIADSQGVGTITNDDPPGTVTISGRITDAVGNPLSEVMVTLSGPITRKVLSDVNGNYSFSGLTPGGDYAVTVQSDYYVFAASRVSFDNLVINQIANFVAAPVSIPPPPPALSDDFSGPGRSPDPTKWNFGAQSQPGTSDPAVTVEQVDGNLVITPLFPRQSGMHYNGIVSRNPFDINNGSAAAEVVQAAGDGADTIFAMGNDPKNFFRFLVHTASEQPSNLVTVTGDDDCSQAPQNTTISCLLLQVVSAGQLSTLNIRYEPVQHRFMRFRHLSPTVLEPNVAMALETSPDDITYTIRRRIEFGRKPLNPMRVELSAGTTRTGDSITSKLSAGTGGTTSPEPAKFDNLKVNAFPSGPGNFKTVLAADQVAIQTWTLLGRTYAYVRLSFPNAGYRVANWGLPARVGNTFSANASVEKSTGGSVQAVTTTAQIYDLGQLADGDYTFTFRNLGTAVRSQAFTVTSTTPPANPIDDTQEFVKQQYRDFLNREADEGGLLYWIDNIAKCSLPDQRLPGETEPQCTLRQRAATSGAFVLSPEFQSTGYYVYLMYQGALGRQPMFSEFTPDAQFVAAGITSAAKVNQNKADYAQQFVNCTDATKYRCSEFKAIYDHLSNQEYVDKLFQTTGVNASASDRAALVNGLTGGTETRASVLQKVVDGVVVTPEGNLQFTTTYGKEFYDQQRNRAGVQMEYFGYLRRDPDEGGYAFWLAKLNASGDNFVTAAMVRAFITSPEYRARFGHP